MVMRSCAEIEGGLPARLKSQMLINIVLDFFVGLIPFIGDIADAIYKCNTRNAILLENHLRKENEKRAKSGNRPALTDPSLPDEFDKSEEDLPGSGGQPRRSPERSPSRRTETRDRDAPRNPNHPKTHKSSRPSRERSRDDRGWTGRAREGDLEMGTVPRGH